MDAKTVTLGALFNDLSEPELWLLGGKEAAKWHPLEALRSFVTHLSNCQSEEDWHCAYPCYLHIKQPADCASAFRAAMICKDLHIRGGYNSRCDDTNCIIGPAAFGVEIVMRQMTSVVGPAFVGSRMYVGQGVRITNSFCRQDAKIRFSTRVARCLLGQDVLIASSAVLDDEAGGSFGLFAGDCCRIGAGAYIAPDVILLPGTTVEPGVRIRRSGVFSGVIAEDILPQRSSS